MSVEEDQPVVDESNNQPKQETPIPWGQLTPLLSVPLSEAINFDLILPFLYQMVEGFGIAENPKNVSFYASLLFTSFSLCQVMTVMHWGRLSDRLGRRPVLMAGLTGNLISSILLGIAPSFWVALLARSFNGFMAGNVVVVKSVIAEISDDSNRHRIMGMLPLTWNTGSMIGAAVGGMLAAPATQYPGLFGNIRIFVKFPYLLPCLVGSANTVFGLFSTMLRFKETLIKRNTNTEDVPLLRELPQQKSIKELLTPTVVKVMVTNVVSCLAMSMYDQIYPIFAATPIVDGGLGFGSRSIGATMAVGGIATFYLQLVVYPRRDRKYGSLVCYQHGQKIVILYLLCMPFLNILASKTSEGTAEFYLLWMILVCLLLVRVTGQVLTFTSMNLLVANIAPSRSDFGAINGMQQLAFSSMRIVGPLMSGVMWSWSIKHGYAYPFNYHLVWVFCAAINGVSLYMIYQLPASVNKFLAN